MRQTRLISAEQRNQTCSETNQLQSQNFNTNPSVHDQNVVRRMQQEFHEDLS